MIVSIHSSRDFAQWRREALAGDQPSLAPYGLEHLCELGFELEQAEPGGWLERGPARRLAPLERRARLRLRRAIHGARMTRRADLALALLEPQSYAYSLLATLRVPPWSTTPLAALVCWLADDFRLADSRRKAWLRECVKGTALFIYLSRNQAPILREQLGIPEERLLFVPFGIEAEYYTPRAVQPRERYVLAAGIDRGRDYRTFLAAVSRLNLPVKLLCPTHQLRGLEIPPNVETLGFVEKARYRDLLRDATLAVVPVKPDVAYPTGQSVLLAAMACEVPTVVTATESLADYTRHGENTWTVPGEDPEALRAGIEHVLGDPGLAAEIARGGRRDVEASFNTAAMWRTVAPRLRALVRSRR